VRRLLAASGLALLFAFAAAASAQDEPPATPTPGWEFSFAPYLWMAGLEGTAEAGGVSSDIDVSFSDIFDALDVGVLGVVEAKHGRFSFTTNVIYMKLSTEASKPVGGVLPGASPGEFEVRVASQTGIFELRPSYEVLSLPLFGSADERRIALDLGAGARIVWLDNHLHVKLKPGVPVGPFSRRFDENTEWVDFVAAARVRARLTEKLGLVVSGDYGGFDIGSSSHRTWSLAGFLSYRLGESWDLVGGWRTLEIERDIADVTMEGPVLGAIYRF